MVGDSELSTFGYSLTGGVDMDGNKYPGKMTWGCFFYFIQFNAFEQWQQQILHSCINIKSQWSHRNRLIGNWQIKARETISTVSFVLMFLTIASSFIS